MSTVKLNEKEQKNMKVVSKILYLIGKVGSILMKVAMVFIIIAMIIMPILFAKLEVKNNNLVYDKSVLEIKEASQGVEITLKNSDNIKIAEFDNEGIRQIKQVITQRNKYATITIFELGLAAILVSIYLVSKICDYLYKLFKNISEQDTPFTMENVEYIKKMACYMIACIFIPAVGEALLNTALLHESDLGLDMFNVVEIIFLYAISIIFEYGYKIQKDSKSKMYGKEPNKK